MGANTLGNSRNGIKKTSGCLNNEHIQHHARASTPDGPAEPLQCRAVLLIMFPSMASKMTGSAGRALGKVQDKSASLARGFPLGCSDSRMFDRFSGALFGLDDIFKFERQTRSVM